MRDPRKSFEHLYSPFTLKHLTVRNRIVKPAQWTVFANPDGSVSDRILAHYEALAKGGAGIITVEESIFDLPLGASNMPHLRLDPPEFLEGWKKLAQVIRKHGAAGIVQVTHAGPAHSPLMDQETPVAPSRLDPPVEPYFGVARELAKAEIEDLIERFAQAAKRVQEAGFDGVELHMAHYALVNAFLSRVQNKRNDEYGCNSLEDRVRFSLGILRRTRELVGDAFIVGIRMNGQEWGHPDGTTREEAIWFAKQFAANGCDYLQVSAYGYGPYSLNALPDLVTYPEVSSEVRVFAESIPEGALVHDASIIREAAGIPVSGVGYIEPAAAEELLRENKVDLVCMGRPLLADPALPNKLLKGLHSQITPCVRCNVCLHHILMAQPVQCRMNAFLGREGTWTIAKTTQHLKVVVVGAGPAGMEAARVAAMRGHHVVLLDRADEPGGLVPMATFIKGGDTTDKLNEIVHYYRTRLEELRVDIRLGTDADTGMIKALKPDAVILAVGARTELPDIPGIEQKIVMSTDDLRASSKGYVELVGPELMQTLSKIYLPLGKRVVVIGGQMAGLQAAEFLVKRGREVTVMDSAEQLGGGIPLPWLVRLMPWLQARGVALHSAAKDITIVSDGVRFVDSANRDWKTHVEADNVLVVTQYRPNTQLRDALKDKVPAVHLVGDAHGTGMGNIQEAIRQGAEAAMAI
jgi:2,4-dienoyl-CoA reductase (NADPH2)